MLVVGLTGGIGSGKSSAAAMFAALGIPVIDADLVAREVVQPGTPSLAEIAARFGPDVLDASGKLDREQLRKRVFADPAERRWLEAVLHPRIRHAMQQRMRETRAPYCLLVIPLLVETGQTSLVQRILVIDTPVELQYRRVSSRDGLSREEIAAILKAQATREQRLETADDVIVNDGDLVNLERQVQALHAKYLEFAHERR